MSREITDAEIEEILQKKYNEIDMSKYDYMFRTENIIARAKKEKKKRILLSVLVLLLILISILQVQA